MLIVWGQNLTNLSLSPLSLSPTLRLTYAYMQTQQEQEQQALEPVLPDSRLARESIMMAANYVRAFHSKPLNVGARSRVRYANQTETATTTMHINHEICF